MVLRRMQWRVGCDLNVTEDGTVITQVRIKLGEVAPVHYI
jgi:hypothetical protein